MYYPYVLITLSVLCFLALNFYAYKNAIQLPIYLELILVLALIIFAGLRSDDVDYMGYIDIFNKVDAAAHKSLLHQALKARDILFGFMVIIKSSLGLSTPTFLLACATLSVGIKYVAFRYAFGNAILGLSLYFFTFYFLHDFTQIRLAIALACCFLALVLILKEHRVWYVFFCIVAVGFHAQTVFFVVATTPLLTNLKYKHLLVFISIMVIGLLFSSFDFFLNLTASRTSPYPGESHLKTTTLIAFFMNAVMIALTYLSSIGHFKQSFDQEMAKVSLMLYFGGFLFFFITLTSSGALAWRVYEMFCAFGIFIMIAALRTDPKKTTVLTIFIYYIFNFFLIIRSDLLVEYSITSSLGAFDGVIQ
jgi:hypothetical protein